MTVNNHRVFEKEVVDSYPGFIACINSLGELEDMHKHTQQTKNSHMLVSMPDLKDRALLKVKTNYVIWVNCKFYYGMMHLLHDTLS